MCGIFGYVCPKRLNDQAILDSLRRRGPDAKGVRTFPLGTRPQEPPCVLLHTRLAVIDLSEQANQPMVDADGEYAIVYNGEIYNFRELRSQLQALGHRFRTHSDTEVLLAGYRQWGADVLQRLRGMFAFCVYDGPQESLFLARDPFGMKPLYYVRDGRSICFSSTVNAILRSGFHPTYSLDHEAIQYYLALGAFQSPDTIFRDCPRENGKQRSKEYGEEERPIHFV